MEKQHKIRLMGTTADGVSIDQATAILGKLFKREPERLRSLFSGKPLTLPMKLTGDQAGKLHAYLNKAGIPCDIESPEPEPVKSSETVFEIDHGDDAQHEEAVGDENAESAADLKSAEKHFVCPKCGTEQVREETCVKCGIVFNKYFAQQAMSSPGDRRQEGEATGEPELDELVEYFVSTNSDVYMNKFDAIRDGARATWHWPAFFVPFYWALYRKMWFISVVAFITQIFWPIANIVFGLVANQLYYQHAVTRVQQFSKKFRGQMLYRKLDANGGTSWTPVIIAIVLTIVLNLLLFKILVDTMQEMMGSYEYPVSMEQSEGNGNGSGSGIVFLNDGEPVAKPALQSQKQALQTSITMAGVAMQYAMVSRGQQLSLQRLKVKLRLSSSKNRDGWGSSMELERTETGYKLISAGADKLFDTGDEILLFLDAVESYR